MWWMSNFRINLHAVSSLLWDTSNLAISAIALLWRSSSRQGKTKSATGDETLKKSSLFGLHSTHGKPSTKSSPGLRSIEMERICGRLSRKFKDWSNIRCGIVTWTDCRVCDALEIKPQLQESSKPSYRCWTLLTCSLLRILVTSHFKKVRCWQAWVSMISQWGDTRVSIVRWVHRVSTWFCSHR